MSSTSRVRLDGRGFRNPPEADPAAPLAFVGDSFCFGWGVTPDQSFPTLVAARLGMPVYNYCTVGADLLDDLDVVRAWMPPRRAGATVLTVTFENDVLAYPETAGDGGAVGDRPGAQPQRLEPLVDDPLGAVQRRHDPGQDEPGDRGAWSAVSGS